MSTPATCDLVLEAECQHCAGRGGRFIEGSGGWKRCGLCNGAGHVPTEQGQRILSLLRHNLKPMLEDLQAESA